MNFERRVFSLHKIGVKMISSVLTNVVWENVDCIRLPFINASPFMTDTMKGYSWIINYFVQAQSLLYLVCCQFQNSLKVSWLLDLYHL